MKRKHLYLILLHLLFFTSSIAQKTTLHVVTQTVQKEWDWQPDKTLVINGENAIIIVEAWDKNKVQASTELIAKHPDKKIAERDVVVQRVIAETTRRTFLLGNQLVLEKGMDKPEANLKAKFTIYVPQSCALRIKNRFGSIEVKGIKNTVEINSQFTKLNLADVKGEIKLSSNFGDILGQQLTGNVTIDANRSDIQLDHPSGNFTIAAKYGTVTVLETENRHFDLDIKGKKTNVVFIEPVLLAHNFRLATEFGEIRVPANAAFEFIENSQQRKEVVLNRAGNASQVSVALSYGNITFQ